MPARKLDYDSVASRWQGEEDYTIVWMNDATFHRYVQTYLEGQGIDEPTLADRIEAVEHCRDLDQWLESADEDVHVVRVGKRYGRR